MSRGESASAHTMVGFVSIAEKKDRGPQNGPLSLPLVANTKKRRIATTLFLLGVPLCGRRVFSCKSSGQVDPMC